MTLSPPCVFAGILLLSDFVIRLSLIILGILLLSLSSEGVARRQQSQEETLLTQLFTDYNPSARPVIDSTRSVNVDIQFSLLHIKELDVRSQVLTTTGLLILEWDDERLVWDPSHYDNISELILEAKKLWRPEFAAINGAEKIYDEYDNFRAIINSNGTVRWEPGGVFQTMCQIDITYYPFDDQHCQLMFGAWSYHTSKMNLSTSSQTINLDSYKINGEWEMIGTKVERKEFNYDCCPDEKFANVVFAVYIRRRHTFYIMNVILPSILTSVLLLSIFFCTPGQKVQIGVVVLLSFRIFLLNVADNIPKTSDHIPLLGVYLTCTMAITTLSMVLTVFVLNLHHIEDRPVPRLVKQIVLFYMAHLLGVNVKDPSRKSCCTSRNKSTSTSINNNSNAPNSVRTHYRPETTSRDRAAAVAAAAALGYTNRSALYHAATVTVNNETVTNLVSTSDGCSSSTTNSSPVVLGNNGSSNYREHINMIRMEPKLVNGGVTPPASSMEKMSKGFVGEEVTKHLEGGAGAGSGSGIPAEDDSVFLDEDASDAERVSSDDDQFVPSKEEHGPPNPADFSKDWKKIAEVFDRLFFWLFLLAIFISTLILFHPLTDSYIKRREW